MKKSVHWMALGSTLAILAASQAALAERQGDNPAEREGGNGGNPLAIHIQQVARKLFVPPEKGADVFPEGYCPRALSGVQIDESNDNPFIEPSSCPNALSPEFPRFERSEFEELVDQVDIQIAQKPLYEDGIEVPARNFPHHKPRPLVRFNEAKFKAFSNRMDAPSLIAHEYLSIFSARHHLHLEGNGNYKMSAYMASIFQVEPEYANWSCMASCFDNNSGVYPNAWNLLPQYGPTSQTTFEKVKKSCPAEIEPTFIRFGTSPFAPDTQYGRLARIPLSDLPIVDAQSACTQQRVDPL